MRVRLALLSALLCNGGCLTHTVRVEPADEAPRGGQAAVGTQVQAGAPQLTRRSPLPHEVPVSWAVRDEAGRLGFAQAIVRSPLPWWQRFPADFFVDLWPGEVEVECVHRLSPQPLVPRSHAEITAEARAHGYAD
ncbi:MAG: hypothetical protein RMM29_08135 [Planctomycetota bacterium]|nr:hypothetical protein [Planctomycetota bacterium]MCX8039477.1 hypothetical protein [Planctomycetota bacterium]MDW8373595.1 hypothetical protein [Planctomycetota bacterium]